jgi:hypothetical protein
LTCNLFLFWGENFRVPIPSNWICQHISF